MKRIIQGVVLSLITQQLFAFSCSGNCELDKQKLDSVYSAGHLILNESKVTGNMQVAGNFKASAAHINSLFAAGKTELDNTVIEGEAKMTGNTIANGSTFNGDTLVAAKASFTNCKLAKTVKLAGKTEMVNTRVVGRMSVAGMLIAKRSIFDSPLLLSAESAIFSRSQLRHGLTIQEKAHTPIIEILCDSQIKGDITFAGKAGIVKTEYPEQVKWKIHNGRLEKAASVACTK